MKKKRKENGCLAFICVINTITGNAKNHRDTALRHDLLTRRRRRVVLDGAAGDDVGGRVEAQEDGLGVVGVVARAAHEVGEGEAAVLRHAGEAQELGAEEEQRVEQHDGGVGPQLLAVPQVLLLHP